MTIYRILIVEDDLDMQEMMVSFLQKSGFMVSAVKNASELSDELKSQRIDLVLLDVMLGDDNGIKEEEEDFDEYEDDGSVEWMLRMHQKIARPKNKRDWEIRESVLSSVLSGGGIP